MISCLLYKEKKSKKRLVWNIRVMGVKNVFLCIYNVFDNFGMAFYSFFKNLGKRKISTVN